MILATTLLEEAITLEDGITLEEGKKVVNWLLDFANTYLVDFAVNGVLAVLELLIGIKLVKFLTARIEKHKVFLKLDSNFGALILNTLKITLNALVIIIAVQILGVPSATIVAAIGSCGLAVGLALQGGLSNLAGGVMIMIFKPFHYNDYVCTEAGDGYVEEIGLFYTKLITVDNRQIHIPNSILSSTTVVNLFAKEVRGVDIEISLAYGTDIDLAKLTLLRCAEAHPLVLNDPPTKVFVSDHSDSCIKITLRVFVNCRDHWQVKFDLLESTLKALAKEGLEIPFPQVDVHMK